MWYHWAGKGYKNTVKRKRFHGMRYLHNILETGSESVVRTQQNGNGFTECIKNTVKLKLVHRVLSEQSKTETCSWSELETQ
jgi:hypothetical protein